METVLPAVPPALPDYEWRPAAAGDIPALERLQASCNGGTVNRFERTPFEALVTPKPGFQPAAVCAVDHAGEIGAFAAALVYSTDTEYRGELEVLVDPQLRTATLESALLGWAEEQARLLLRRRGRENRAVLRLPYADRRDHAWILYPRHGFHPILRSDTMRRDLHDPLPACRSPEHVRVLPWSRERADQFYQVVQAAFGDRPSSIHGSAGNWCRLMTEIPVFCPDLSLLALEREQPAGFIICWIDETRNADQERAEGWITQLGVQPSRQGRGLGSYLLCRVMGELQRRAIDDALLEVDVTNRPAYQLYRRLGFTPIARLHVFAKPLADHLPR